MKKIIAKKDFLLDDIFYIKDEELKNLSYEDLVMLNKKGFIQPISFQELILLKRELEKINKNKEENHEI